MRRVLFILVLTLPSLGAVFAQTERDEQKPKKKPAKDAVEFVRYTKGEKVARLETASVTFENVDTGQKITLYGVLRVGDKAYFDALKRHMTRYETVLTEKEAADPSAESRDLFWVTRLQLFLREYLELEDQRLHFDHGAKNLLVVDAEAEAVRAELDARGLDDMPFAPVLKGIGPIVEAGVGILAKATKDSNSPALRQARAKLKQTIARYLGTGLKLYDRLKRKEDKVRDEIIIGMRNVAVVEKVHATLATGKPCDIAVVYDAIQMPDLLERLREIPGLQLSKTEWIPAWTMQLDASEDEDETDPTEKESAPESKPAERRKI